MYHIYKTEGLVIGGFDKKESSRLLYIFTRELGLILAQVQSVRDLKSKLRYSLQDFSHSYIDLVRGKSGWRIISARNEGNLTHNLSHDTKEDTIGVLSRTIILLRRLVKGEEQNEKLFDELMGGYQLLRSSSLSKDEILNLEIIIVMRMLNVLGYWGENDKLSPFLEGGILKNNLLGRIEEVKPLALRGINSALKSTQL